MSTEIALSIEAPRKIKTLHFIKADTHREFGRFSWPLLVWGCTKSRSFRVIVTYRLRCRSRLFGVLHYWTSRRAGIQLPHTAPIGPGLKIFHGHGIIVSHRAVLGANVTLCHGVTIGNRIGCAPVIEDEVRIGPNAVLIGGITIGRGSRIAPLALVLDSVPARSVVMGNPACVVKTNARPDVVNQVATL